MKKRFAIVLVPIIAFVVPLAVPPQAAEAKGCIKGAAVGAAAGHVAKHHGVLGAIGGCLVGRHLAKKRR